MSFLFFGSLILILDKLLFDIPLTTDPLDKFLILRVSNIIGYPNNNKRKLHKTFVDIFFENKKGHFMNLPTGQGIFYKKN